MASEADNPAPEAIPDDGIPVLREIVQPGDEPVLPVLDPAEAIIRAGTTDNGLSVERLAELADTLQLTLSRELDYAIDGAVYERFQNAMEEVAASVKKKVQAQLEQKLPELIEQTLGKQL
jgi:hypothetical protein